MSNVPHTKAIAILGTGSDVGKSLVASGLCRLLHRAGVRVAPFKAQNMSLNSFVTSEGGEIGRAQALQAEACGIPPHVDMNPILLKPESDSKAQVIVQGRVFSTLDAQAYFTRTRNSALFRAVQESYGRLASQYEVIVIEGAGSAAEVNLRDRDLVNWPVVEMADAQVVLVADIDRGGVFAQIVGTLDLIAKEERARVCGIVINKFRGDAVLFADGVRFLTERTGIPVLGVLPFLRDLALDQEDSLDVETRQRVPFESDSVNIAVLLLPHMSNFTDFNALAEESDVRLRYVADPEETAGADAIMIPGTKMTLADLEYLRAKGFEPLLQCHVQGGGELVGICGGYQMLGRRITDPDAVESGGAGRGFGFLDVTTIMMPDKITEQVQAHALHLSGTAALPVRGYLIHMGRTDRHGLRPCFRFHSAADPAEGCRDGEGRQDDTYLDGAVRDDGLVWGTYIHGLFDQASFRRSWLNRLRSRKGLSDVDLARSQVVNDRRTNALDRWADHVEQHLDLGPIWNLMRQEGRAKPA
ncbi:MAG: Cobyric acid synthase [Nitrospira sp.]|jgi:adenosylcobyric acid synthase|nr:MAG: Cobyric acid synthase [Nitrospira sp.]